MKITVATGDGIGSEVMGAVLDIFHQAGVPLEYEVVPMGKTVALSGEKSGLSREARESVESTGLLFKGPMETPAGADYKSVTLTARKLWGTFANKRVFRTLPGVPTPIANQRINLTMVRENIEDTYAAVEHMQTPDVAQCRRFITRPGSEQVHRYTFRMASRKGAKRVTCAHKADVMKLTDGLFLEAFYDVAKEFTHLEVDAISVEALAMRLVLDPSEFDVVVVPNLPGDILTDLAAGLVGGLAYAPAANIGDGICIFEAAHGTSPNIVGQDLANPSALLLSGTMMLRHVGLVRHADVIETALQRTLLDMHRRPDLGEPIPVFRTSSFVERMSDELGRLSVPAGEMATLECHVRAEPKMWVSKAPAQSGLKGVDVFLESNMPPAVLADALGSLSDALTLTMISNRGTEVWPHGSAYTDCVNHYCIRFESDSPVEQRTVLSVLEQLAQHHTLCGAEWLREIDGTQAYSSAQGQN